MNSAGKHILLNFKKRWQTLLGFEVFLYAFGTSVFTYFLSLSPMWALIVFSVVGLIIALMIKPWQPDLNLTSSYLDEKLDSAEYSTGLLLLPEQELSNVAKLQQIKVLKVIDKQIKALKPPHHLFRTGLISGSLILIGFLVFQSNLLDYFKPLPTPGNNSNSITFQPSDTLINEIKVPKILKQSLIIRYPKYTNISVQRTSTMDVKVLEGSRLSWTLEFDTKVESVFMQSMGNNHSMKFDNGVYKGYSLLTNSGFYNFKYLDNQGNSYTSDLYGIEVTKDLSPEIKILGLPQFSSFDFNEDKNVKFTSIITDDYGIAEAYIIATVSKGSGESVKFREEKLSFDNKVPAGRKSMTLSKKIDLDKMKMEPGDELYFYIETSDYKLPIPNKTRSETFFAVIKDTISYEFSVEGTLGVDRMPDYFRSQRQLIIDTEKLISNKTKLSKSEFNFNSNELGFDQKALRLKYGEFMGQETEGGLVESKETQPEQNEDDPLAEFTHDHDGDNEHNLVDKNNKDKDSKNPLQEFTHDHEDPEKATLFEESLKVKLLKALNEMWDAELYLRLYTPEKSLPYQYRALELIQEIKNSARIYVHRIGFDPPPIKEDKRLTGKLDEVNSFKKSEDLLREDAFQFMRQTVSILERIINQNTKLTETDLKIFELASHELAQKAIETPGKYLKTLQQLKDIVDGKKISIIIFSEVQKVLFNAIRKPNDNPIKGELFTNEINQLLLKELDGND